MLEQTAEDLAEADKQRREDFKTYEMEKEFEKQQKLKELDDEKQKKYLEELEEQKQKHKKHDPVPVTIGSLAWWRPFLCYALLHFLTGWWLVGCRHTSHYFSKNIFDFFYYWV